MKEYNVSFLTDNNGQYEGREPHSDIYDCDSVPPIEAENEFEAIDFALDYLAECVSNNATMFDGIDFEVDRDEQNVTIYNKHGEVVQHFYNFKAEEIGS